MKVAVTGATGMMGSALVRALREREDEVTALSRDAERASSSLGVNAQEWKDPKNASPPPESLRGRDAVVHLLGESVNQRWTDDAKREIRDSRVLSTRNLVTALGALPEADRPRVLVSQSATGYYGPRGDERVTEGEPAGEDFLAKVVRDWEAEALKASELGVRVVTTRTGVVLSPEGGALATMLPFFKLGVGGPVAGGRQYVPWIHLDDVVGALITALDDDGASGPVNLAAPEPVTNRRFSKALGRVLGRPALAPIPAFAVKALYGEMATVVTTGARVEPARLKELGYGFQRADLDAALSASVYR
jgi:uncharacterized protein (TIGR01777 family)